MGRGQWECGFGDETYGTMLGPVGRIDVSLKLFAVMEREGRDGDTFPYRSRQERFRGLHGRACSGSS